LATAAKCKPSD